MRLWLLRATPLLAAVLGIWPPLSFATPMLGNKIDPVIRVGSQQHQNGPEAPSLSTAYILSTPSVKPSTMQRRGGIHAQELSSGFLLRYHAFTVSILETSPEDKTCRQEKSETTFLFPSLAQDPEY